MHTLKKFEFHFDFGSPNAYLSHRVIPTIERKAGCKFEYVPVLLGGVFKLTNNRSPMESFAGIKNKMEYQQLETKRFIARHGIDDFQMNPFFPVNTLMMMRGAIAAQTLGGYERYVDAMFKAMWAEPRKMDDPQVWAGVLQANGFDAVQFAAAIQSAEVKEKLMANTARSVERGAFGSPTFFVGDEIYFGKDRLDDVAAAIASS
jgi:2-hydroxychromene-2-carboxylate isomerase